MRFSRLLIALSLAIVSSLRISAQQPPTPQQPKTTQDLTALAEAQKSSIPSLRAAVVYLEVHGAGNSPAVAGTGFFVFLDNPTFPYQLIRHEGYLVTNRHVAQPGIDIGEPHDAVQVLISSNLRIPQGGKASVTESIPLGGSTHWYFSKDESLDLAVLPWSPNMGRYEVGPISTNSFATEEKIKANAIDIGDPVLFTGLFTSRPGSQRVEPIVRQGTLAMVPSEAMDTTLHKPGHIYLADAHAFHGNSGSPMFINVGGAHHGAFIAEDRYLLLGVVSGYFPEKAGYIVPAASVLTGEVRDNSGIAVVVPAYELLKLLSSVQDQLDQEKANAAKKP
ncbi:MAG TPA: trypsin-like serine protease [Candidatus Baltobacteraceae bacterium]|jgi:hypothetical protein|nr:trypsin-like serine protease [Candidatus Baltobacteraceae bacterium]